MNSYCFIFHRAIRPTHHRGIFLRHKIINILITSATNQEKVSNIMVPDKYVIITYNILNLLWNHVNTITVF